jgi:hypothetical protein
VFGHVDPGTTVAWQNEATSRVSVVSVRKSPSRLAEEITEENPDRTTRRVALELELMDEGRSAEGANADLDEAER